MDALDSKNWTIRRPEKLAELLPPKEVELAAELLPQPKRWERAVMEFWDMAIVQTKLLTRERAVLAFRV